MDKRFLDLAVGEGVAIELIDPHQLSKAMTERASHSFDVDYYRGMLPLYVARDDAASVGWLVGRIYRCLEGRP